MGRPKQKDILELATSEIPDLIKAVEGSSLDDRHKQIILTLINQLTTIKQTDREKAAALAKISRMLGKKTEKDRKKLDLEKSPSETKNHGRHAVSDYAFSRVVDHQHDLNPGDECPLCAHGTLQAMAPRKVIRLVGQPSIVAELHQPARLRCSGCGGILTAPMPEAIGDEKATASANAMVAIFRYGMGMPHYRLAAIQGAMGVPLPSSTQYEMVEMLWTQAVPVYKELIEQAANCPLFFIDDTGTKILSLLQRQEQLKEAGERTGMFTTGIVARKENHQICLFFSGRKHAGENLTDLLNRRSSDLPNPIQVSDALSRNFPKDHFTIVVLCLIHARRNFIDCQEAFPDESTYVIERIGQVYGHEKQACEKLMGPQQRLEHHQKLSLPIMEEIKTYAQAKLDEKRIEPNSILGGAFKYLIKHWEGLTQFLKVPGAPLDNNEAERLLKTFVRHRKNSLFYKTEDGARVGDVLMSLIQTAIAADANPFEYLAALGKHSQHAAKNPHLWLPWNYHHMLKSVETSKTAEAQPQTN